MLSTHIGIYELWADTKKSALYSFWTRMSVFSLCIPDHIEIGKRDRERDKIMISIFFY